MKKMVLIIVSALLLLVLIVSATFLLWSVVTPLREAATKPQPTVERAIDSLISPAVETGKVGTISLTAEERMIVRTGEMSLVVKNVLDTRDKIADLAVRFNGYVVSSQIWGDGQRLQTQPGGWITIRVPDDKFEQALSELKELAVRITSESIGSQDVTEEFVDLESRLKNAEVTEKQFLTLLERADKVEDILKIYESSARVRGEIEQIKGRMQYLERTVAMSLISVHLEPEVIARPLIRAGWSVFEVLKSAIRGLIIFGQYLSTIAIWLIIFSPVWGAIFGIFLYWRRRKRSI